MKTSVFYILTFLNVLFTYLKEIFPNTTIHTFFIYIESYRSIYRNVSSLLSNKLTTIERLYTNAVLSMTTIVFISAWYILPFSIKFITKKNQIEYIRSLLFKLFILIFLFNCFVRIKIQDLFISYIYKTTFYEENYIAVDKKDIKAPTLKKNVIFIVAESLEQKFKDKDLFNENLLPNLSKQDGFSFSNFQMIAGAENTAISIMSNFCSLPIMPAVSATFSGNISYTFSKLYCLPDILHKENYQTYFFRSAIESYSVLFPFLKTHHVKTLLGSKSLRRDKNDYGFKMFDAVKDSRVFEHARNEILRLEKTDKPFFMGILTANTHEPDGFVEKECNVKYNDLRDAILCSDKDISEFIDFVKTTSIYKDTIILVVGDHETRDLKMLDHFKGLKNRPIFNLWINAPMPKSLNRTFATIDISPTLLEAIGFKINAKSFGLGHSLYKKNPTLLEKIKKKDFESELKKRSDFYINLLKEE